MADIVLSVDFSTLKQAEDKLKALKAAVKSFPVNALASGLSGLEGKIKQLVDAQSKGTIGAKQYNLGLLDIKRAYEQLGLSSQQATARVRAYAAGLQAEAVAATQAKAEQEQLSLVSAKAETAFALGAQKARELAAAQEEAARASQKLAAEKDKLSLKYNSAYAAAQLYDSSLAELNRAHELGVLSAEKHRIAVAELENEYKSFQTGSANFSNRFVQYTAQTSRGLNKFGFVAQQVGYQVGDFFVQVQSGTNALTAFGQQATQLAGLLPGVFGAAVGIAISLGTALGMSALRANKLTIDFQKIGKDIVTALSPVKGLTDAIANGLTAAGGAISTAFKTAVDNLDRIAVYATVAATAFAGKFVYGLVASAVATFNLSKALTVLRGALIRTGFGALVVAAGELVYQFLKVSEAVGGIGNAFTLLGSVAVEVWDRIGLSVDSTIAGMSASWYSLLASIYEVFQKAVDSATGFGNKTVGVFQGAFDSIKVIWGALPSAIGDFAISAANNTISAVESMLNAVVEKINAFILGINGALAKLPGGSSLSLGTVDPVKLGGLDNPYAGAGEKAGTAVANAFNKALNKNYINSPSLFGNLASGAKTTASALQTSSQTMANAANAPMTAWEKLKGIFTSGSGGVGVDPSSWLKPDPGKGGGGGGSSKTDPMAELLKDIKRQKELLGLNQQQVALKKELWRIEDALGESAGKYSTEKLTAIAKENLAIQAQLKLQEEQQRAMDNLANTMAQSVGDAFMSIVDGTSSVKDAFKQMAADIIKQLLQVLVVQRLVGSWDRASGVGSGLAGFFGKLLNFEGGGYTGSGGRSGGLDGKGGFLAMVHPDETIIDHTKRKQVAPAAKPASVGSSEAPVVVNQYFNLSANGDDSVRRIVKEEAPKLAQQAKAAVLDARRRGGSYGKAF